MGRGSSRDVEVAFPRKQQVLLYKQMYDSLANDSKRLNLQNHGSVTGDAVEEGKTIEDEQLKKAVEILGEDPAFEHTITKYHKDTHETQVAASPDKVLRGQDSVDDGSPEVEAPVSPQE